MGNGIFIAVKIVRYSLDSAEVEKNENSYCSIKQVFLTTLNILSTKSAVNFFLILVDGDKRDCQWAVSSLYIIYTL